MLGSDVVIDLAFGVDFQRECIRARTMDWMRLPTAPPPSYVIFYAYSPDTGAHNDISRPIQHF